MYGKYKILGFTGKKTFVGTKGDTVQYARVTLRSDSGFVVDVKASPGFDFSPYLDKTVDLYFVLLKSGQVRCEGVK